MRIVGIFCLLIACWVGVLDAAVNLQAAPAAPLRLPAHPAGVSAADTLCPVSALKETSSTAELA